MSYELSNLNLIGEKKSRKWLYVGVAAVAATLIAVGVLVLL